jgi:selenide,water dikinase
MDVPIVKELLLIGGGHAHALVLRRWGMRPVPGVRLTLVNPEATAPYTGMLPGHLAGHYPREALDIDLVRLARFAGARFIPGGSWRWIPRRRWHARLRAAGRYDIASLDIGITSTWPRCRGLPSTAFRPSRWVFRRTLGGGGGRVRARCASP